MTWIQLRSGTPWDLLEPRAEDVHLEDIAFALSHINRFTGHAGPYSVCQHSLLVEARVTSFMPGWPHLSMAALLHDAHETYLGDLSSPVKAVLRQLGCGFQLRELGAIHDAAIAEWAGLRGPAAFKSDIIKRVDLELLSTERRDLMGPCDREWPPMPEPLPYHIRVIQPPSAVQEDFCHRFHELKAAMAGAAVSKSEARRIAVQKGETK